jgi:predicted GIY-YIG superfamily endonuclease
MLPVELLYFEAYRSKDVAFEREKNLKKYGSGLAKLKTRIGIAKKGRAG